MKSRVKGFLGEVGVLECFFKGLADITRLRIINLLFHGELCGCDVQYVVDASQSNISRHLTYLKNSGLVVDRRSGYRVYYRFSNNESFDHRLLFDYLRHAFGREKVFADDLKKLKNAIKDGACTVSERQLAHHEKQESAEKNVYS